MTKIPVGILGATGMVGQRMVQLLSHHPYFEVCFVAASARSAGKPYQDAVSWRLAQECPEQTAQLLVHECQPSALPNNIQLVFSAMDGSVAGPIEAAFRDHGCFVVSNASAWRSDPNTPLIIPEVNPKHLSLLGNQPTSGIIANPNCCVIPLALSLAPLHQKWGIEAVCVATYQAVSGAGYPGESAWDMVGNVHPHAGNEEQKLASEPLKVLGSPHNAANMTISARCVRVPTADGHLLAVQARLKEDISIEQVKQQFIDWQNKLPSPLPSSPRPLLRLSSRRDRPSPRFDIMAGGGMAVTIGRLESCAVMGVKFFALAHNTIRGAAGAAIANGELLVRNNLLSQ